jgi:hypothetical protein
MTNNHGRLGISGSHHGKAGSQDSGRQRINESQDRGILREDEDQSRQDSGQDGGQPVNAKHVVEHYKWAPCIKAMQLSTTLQGWASDIPRGVQEETMYEETTGAFKDQFGDQHLVVAYHSQMKRRTNTVVCPCKSLLSPSNS